MENAQRSQGSLEAGPVPLPSGRSRTRPRSLPLAPRGYLRSIQGAVGVAFVIEFLTVVALGMFMLWIGEVDEKVSTTGYLLASLFCASTFALIFDYRDLYEQDALLEARRSVVSIIAAAIVAFGALAVTGMAASGQLSYDADWLLGYAFASVIGILLWRVAFARFLSDPATSGLFTRNIIIIGAGTCAIRLLQDMEANPRPWTRVLGMFDDRVRDSAARVPRKIHGVRVLGNLHNALTFSRRMRVDDIVVALPWSAHERINAVVRATERVSANIHLAPDTLGGVAQQQCLTMKDGFPALRVSRKPVSGWNYLLKRATDLAIAVVALILLSPLLLIVALVIKKESRGPVLFRQPRFGINNRTIHILKFRSMYHDQQDLKADRLVTRDDPRVTPVGRFLRRTSIDELPQLWNVLTGEMSIVGPRPHAKNAKAAGRIYQDVVMEYAHRHRIKPGITGWAQVNGWRGETDTEDKIIRRCEHDLYYISHWSFFLDVYIIFATFFRAPFQRNAY